MKNAPSHIKDIGGYIFFSKNTKGVSGRPVKIHTSLFLDFFLAVDPKSHDGQRVIHDIESLTALARDIVMPNRDLMHPKDMSNAKGGKEHIKCLKDIDTVLKGVAAVLNHRLKIRENSLITKNVRVYYHMHQMPGDRCRTVYISEVQIRREGADGGGFYEKSGGARADGLKKVDLCRLDGKSVFISRASESRQQSYEDAVAVTNSHNPVLFFNPASAVEISGTFNDNRVAGPTQELVKELQETIVNNRASKVNWFVEGEGAAILSHAISGVSGTLENHSFKFSNARGNLPKLLQDLSQRKAGLTGEFIKHSADTIARLAMASRHKSLMKVLGALPNAGGYDTISRRYLKARVDDLARPMLNAATLSKVKGLRGGEPTFVEALNDMGSIT